jgi:transcriptional regulator with XRE-family HTH domain
MKIIGERLRSLREGVGLSQAKIAKLANTAQPSINRYESGNTVPPLEMFLWYADYFDVSLDYIFGRTDKPQGKLYNYEPEALKGKLAGDKEIRDFIEFCFESGTAANEKLKASLIELFGNNSAN